MRPCVAVNFESPGFQEQKLGNLEGGATTEMTMEAWKGDRKSFRKDQLRGKKVSALAAICLFVRKTFREELFRRAKKTY